MPALHDSVSTEPNMPRMLRKWIENKRISETWKIYDNFNWIIAYAMKIRFTFQLSKHDHKSENKKQENKKKNRTYHPRFPIRRAAPTSKHHLQPYQSKIEPHTSSKRSLQHKRVKSSPEWHWKVENENPINLINGKHCSSLRHCGCLQFVVLLKIATEFSVQILLITIWKINFQRDSQCTSMTLPTMPQIQSICRTATVYRRWSKADNCMMQTPSQCQKKTKWYCLAEWEN